MAPPYLKGGLDVPSVHLDYLKSTRNQLNARAGFFKVGLNKAKSILNPPPPPVSQRQPTILPHVPSAEPRSRSAERAPKSAEKPQIIQKSMPNPMNPTFVIEDTRKGALLNYLIEERTKERQIRMKATMKANYSLQRDKEFLELIHSTTRSRSFVDLRVRDIAQSALDYIDTRTVYWNQQIPEHVRKTTQSPHLPDEDSCPKSPQQAMQNVVKRLNKINKNMWVCDYQYVIGAATKLMNDVKKMEKRLPGKESIMAICCCILGNAHLESRNEKEAVSFHMQDFRLGSEFNIPVAKNRALDNLGRVYARIGKFKRAIQVWCKRLSSGGNIPLNEKAWLCHELGYCYLKTDDHEKARQCGELSYKAAAEIPDEQTQLNANMLIVQAILLSGDHYGCKESLNKALKSAVRADDETALSESLKELRKAINNYKQEEKEAKERDIKSRSTWSSPKSGYSTRSSKSRSRYIYGSRETLQSSKSSKTLPNRNASPMDSTNANPKVQSRPTSGRSNRDHTKASGEAPDGSDRQQDGATT